MATEHSVRRKSFGGWMNRANHCAEPSSPLCICYKLRGPYFYKVIAAVVAATFHLLS